MKKTSPVKQGRYVQGLSVVFCCRSDSRRSGSNCEEKKKKNPCCHPSLAPVHPITETAGFQLSVSALHTTHKAAISGPLNRHPGSYTLIFSLPPPATAAAPPSLALWTTRIRRSTSNQFGRSRSARTEAAGKSILLPTSSPLASTSSSLRPR